MLSTSEFQSNSPIVNLLLLLVAAVAVWISGVHLTRTVEEVARRTGLGEAFAGFLLLGTVTSLPEIATTATAALMGNAALVTSNLYGGVAAQTCIIAFADLLSGKKALTYRMDKSVLILQACFLVVLMLTAAAAWTFGERVRLWNVGLGSAIVFAVFLVCLKSSYGYEKNEAWSAVDSEHPRPEPANTEGGTAANRSNTALYSGFAGLAAVIVASGWLLTKTADALAAQAGIGSSLIGATLVAVATSLPEISTTFSAVKIGAYSMAVSNIFGGNLFDAALVFPADIIFRERPILEALPRETLYLLLIACVMTLIYVWGLLERRNKTVLRMGIDSVLVLVCYVLGLGGMYLLQSK